MVGRDRIADAHKTTCAGDRLDRSGCRGHIDEERRLLDVSALHIPFKDVASGSWNRLPFDRAFGGVAVFVNERLRRHRIVDGLGDFSLSRPDVFQVNIAAVARLTERLRCEVDVGRSGDRVGHNQRWAGEIVRLHLRVDSTFKVAVAGEDCGDDEVTVRDRFRDWFRQRSTVADAGRATVADGVEAELVERLIESRLREIIGHNS